VTEIAKGVRSTGRDDELVQVAYAPDPGEAAVIQGALESRGIDSLVRSTGVDGPQIGYGLASQVGQLVFVRAAEVEAALSLADITRELDPFTSSDGLTIQVRDAVGPDFSVTFVGQRARPGD